MMSILLNLVIPQIITLYGSLKVQSHQLLIFLDFTNRAFLKKTTKKLVSMISHEWLEESELSTDIIRLLTFYLYSLPNS
jgi:hypothetical protein